MGAPGTEPSASGTAGEAPSGATGEGQPGTEPAADAPDRELQRLRRRLAETELRAREREETAVLRLRELETMEEDLRALDRHARHLEHGRLVLEIELDQVRTRAAELFADLERDEATIAGLRSELAAVQETLATLTTRR